LALKAETAARLGAISRGTAQAQLFGPSEPEPIAEEIEPEFTTSEEQVFDIKTVFEKYIPDIEDSVLKESAQHTLDWIAGTENPEANAKYYARAIENLKTIESSIPEPFRLPHKLY